MLHDYPKGFSKDVDKYIIWQVDTNTMKGNNTMSNLKLVDKNYNHHELDKLLEFLCMLNQFDYLELKIIQQRVELLMQVKEDETK